MNIKWAVSSEIAYFLLFILIVKVLWEKSQEKRNNRSMTKEYCFVSEKENL